MSIVVDFPGGNVYHYKRLWTYEKCTGIQLYKCEYSLDISVVDETTWKQRRTKDMSIFMLGIDHNMAPVDIRAKFAFTKKNAGEAMEQLKERAGIHGCIILSTCNRLEIWASHEDDQEFSLYRCLCELKNIQDPSYEEYFISRQDKEAVEHLFYLAGGLKSQILGEDQILTQIKDALNLAREHFTTDGVLEVLFRMAVTAGKRIKTEAPMAHGNPSVIHQAVSTLREQGYDMHGKTCMVIGNGEMGKVAAQTLRDAGANVTVTVRQYRSGMVSIPIGCSRIHYGERMGFLPKCDVVVSATASPNYTLRRELFQDITLTKPLLLLDLAVNRHFRRKRELHCMIWTVSAQKGFHRNLWKASQRPVRSSENRWMNFFSGWMAGM